MDDEERRVRIKVKVKMNKNILLLRRRVYVLFAIFDRKNPVQWDQ